MKKIVSIIMSIIIILSVSILGGCSSKTSTSNKESSNENAIAPLTIKFSSTFQESETGGTILKHFINRVSELSNGAIKVDMSWGGTLFTASDELDAVMDGAVNMVALAHMPHLNTLTYLSFPSFAPGGSKAALDYFKTLVFDDPETSALIQGEAQKLGIKYLNVIAGGANAFCSKNKFTDLNSLVKGSAAFGNMDAAIFKKLGFKVTSIAPPEVYDALNRGLIDSTQMALAPMVAMSWYEPAPYWALDGTYTAGNFFTVNLSWWDSLTDAQRKVIEQAAKDTQEYTSTLYDEAINKDIATVEQKTGKKLIEFSKEDKDRIWAAAFEAKAESAMELAKAAGKTEGMIKILEKAAEITGYNWKHQ